MNMQNIAAKSKRSQATSSKRRLQYRNKRQRDNRHKYQSAAHTKDEDATAIPAKLAAFPRITWENNTDESTSFDDYCSSSSSLEDYVTTKCCPVQNAEWWVNDDASNRMQEGVSFDHHHLHRSMAFLDLDSLLRTASKHQR